MHTLKIVRTDYFKSQTLGRLFVLDADQKILFECHTLELPWRNNARQVSCIPQGTYQVVRRTSKKYGLHLHILNVPNRSLILIHEANFVRQLLGCIAVGRSRMDIDGDGNLDITSSVATKNRLLTFITQPTTLTIE